LKTGPQIVIDARDEAVCLIYLDRAHDPHAEVSSMDFATMEYLQRADSLRGAIRWANTYMGIYRKVVFGMRVILDTIEDDLVKEVEEFLKDLPPEGD